MCLLFNMYEIRKKYFTLMVTPFFPNVFLSFYIALSQTTHKWNQRCKENNHLLIQKKSKQKNRAKNNNEDEEMGGDWKTRTKKAPNRVCLCFVLLAPSVPLCVCVEREILKMSDDFDFPQRSSSNAHKYSWGNIHHIASLSGQYQSLLNSLN